MVSRRGVIEIVGSQGGGGFPSSCLLVVCVEYICADEVGDCELRKYR